MIRFRMPDTMHSVMGSGAVRGYSRRSGERDSAPGPTRLRFLFLSESWPLTRLDTD
jgi:hypothetical protein